MCAEGMAVDPWRILGVEPWMAAKDVRIAYRRLAMECHPDRNPGDAEAADRFRLIQSAWEKIEAGAVPVAPPSPFAAAFEDIVRASEDFETAQQCGRPERGSDVDAEVFLSFGESLSESRRTLSGRARNGRSRTTTVEIPGGVVNGETLVYAGLGAPGSAGGARGDLRVRVFIGSGDGFAIEGLDVVRTITIPVWDAALGCEVAVPLPRGGRQWMTVPAGASASIECRFPGEGVSAEGRKGDYVVTVVVEVPNAASDPKLGKLFAAMRPGRLAA